VKGSGYRDMKLLVEVEFDNLNLEGVPQVKQERTKFICEIQLLCQKWLENKKTTSLSYKVLRANKLLQLFNDFTKYLTKSEVSRSVPKTAARLLGNFSKYPTKAKVSSLTPKFNVRKVVEYG